MKNHYAAALLVALMIGGIGASSAADATVGQKVEDAALLAKIKAELLASRKVDGLDVNVDVKDGHVTLSGKASNETERARAESIAKDTKGVLGVENRITLKDH